MASAQQSPSPEYRVLPHNLDAERAILGTFYLNNDAVADVMAVIEPEDFYDPRNQEIFRTTIELAEKKKPIDPVVLTEELDRKGLLEKIGGIVYLSSLEQFVISPGNVMHHARIVHEKSLLRQLIRASAEITDDAYLERSEADILLNDSEKKIFDIIKGRRTSEYHAFGDVVQEVWADVLHRSENRQEVTGLSTNYKYLDQMTGGLQRSDLIILAARPSIGKTALALNIAAQVALSKRTAPDGAVYHPGVAVFSLEMSRQQVIQRMVCTRAKVPMELLRKNRMNARQVELFFAAAQEMRDLPIYVGDTPGLDPTELRLQAQQMQMRDPRLSLVIVDYLQLMSVKRKRSESRQQEVSEISRSMKALARDLDVPVIALSQLSRNIETRRGKDQKPKLSDLRESGAIEQDADMVWFIHRDRQVERQAGDAEKKTAVTEAELIIGKQRNGPIGTIRLLFREDFTEFVELAVEKE